MDELQRIKDAMVANGISQKELCDGLSISANCFTAWNSGRNQSYKKYLPAIAELLGVSVDYLAYGNEQNSFRSGFFPVPTGVESFRVVGKVRAGYDGAAVEIETDEICPIPTSLLRGHKKDDFFVLRVEGESMYPRILDGDMILVERTEAVDSGTVAVILYDGEDATVKKVKYMPGEDWLELIPENPAYEIRRIEGHDLARCRILGRVCQLIRNI